MRLLTPLFRPVAGTDAVFARYAASGRVLDGYMHADQAWIEGWVGRVFVRPLDNPTAPVQPAVWLGDRLDRSFAPTVITLFVDVRASATRDLLVRRARRVGVDLLWATNNPAAILGWALTGRAARAVDDWRSTAGGNQERTFWHDATLPDLRPHTGIAATVDGQLGALERTRRAAECDLALLAAGHVLRDRAGWLVPTVGGAGFFPDPTVAPDQETVS